MTLSDFEQAITQAVASLPDGIDPGAIAAALVAGASASGRCPVIEISGACENELAVLDFGNPRAVLNRVHRITAPND